jgi:peptidoglycan/LPS O-acetylase OafA/YrhL
MRGDKVGSEKQARLYFLDNLRVVMVLFVVVFHSALPYTMDVVGFWPFSDPRPSFVLDMLVAFIDVFNMAILFYIAGYFVLPSIRKGMGRFLKGKLIRLGIPWLLGVLFAVPTIDYAFFRDQAIRAGADPVGFLEYWRLAILSIARLNVGFLNQDAFVLMKDQVYQRYMWFLSLLMLFFVAFILVYALKKDWVESLVSSKPTKPSMRLLASFGLSISLPYFLMDFITQGRGRTFFTLWNVIQVQPSKLVFYIGFFALGVYSYAKKWFDDGGPIGNWGTPAILLFFATPLVGKFYLNTAEPSILLQLSFALSYCFLAVSLLVVFISLATKRWNHPSGMLGKNSAYAYHIYLLHYLPANLLPPMLRDWMIPADAKWVIVSMTSILISYALSRYIVRPFLSGLNSSGAPRYSPRQAMFPE